MDRPIAIRKGVRSCTQRPIQDHLSYTNLSLLFRAFVTSIDRVPPNTVQDGLQNPEWKVAASLLCRSYRPLRKMEHKYLQFFPEVNTQLNVNGSFQPNINQIAVQRDGLQPSILLFFSLCDICECLGQLPYTQNSLMGQPT